jgi:hypothetical protein
MVHRHVYGMLLLHGVLHRTILYIIIIVHICILLIQNIMGLAVSITHHYIDHDTTDCDAIHHSMLISHVGLF